MRNIIIFLIIFILIISCTIKNKNTQNRTDIKDYKLVEMDGIYFEIYDSTNNDQNKYIKNNLIFVKGAELTYSYQYITKEGEACLFTENNNGKRLWDCVEKSKIDSLAINSVKIFPKNGNFQPSPQTIINYKLVKKNNDISHHKNITGIVENKMNVWIHPPRMMNFKILELNPFPFIKKPYKIGNNWTWTLNIGSHYGDKEWATWEGEIQNLSRYKITKTTTIQTKLGQLKCFVIESEAKSEIGTTYLTALFNEKYGFIKLDYLNIDGSRIIFKLEDYKVNINTPYNTGEWEKGAA